MAAGSLSACSPSRCSCGWSRTPRRPAGCAGRPRWAGPRSSDDSPVPGPGARPAGPRHPRAPAQTRRGSSAGRDIGQGLLRRATTAPRRACACSARPRPWRCARRARGLLVWLISIGVFALVMGVISDSVDLGSLQSMHDLLEKLGTAATDAVRLPGLRLRVPAPGPEPLRLASSSPAGREDETELRLGGAVRAARVRAGAGSPSGSRLVAAAATALALAAGVLGLGGRDLPRARTWLRGGWSRPGANCLPVSRALPGPRRGSPWRSCRGAGTTIAYALVGAAFLWETIGGLVEAPAGRSTVALPPRRPRARRVVPGRRRRGDARRRRARRPGGGVVLRAPRPRGRVRPSGR